MEALQRLRETWKTSLFVLKMIWGTSKRYTVYIAALLTIGAILPLLDAYLIKKIIDSISRQAELDSILSYLFFFVLVTVFGRIVESQRNASQIVLGNLFNKEINQKVADKTTKIAFWRFEDSKFQDKLDRIRSQATWKPLNTFYYMFDAARNVVMLISIFFVISRFSILILGLMVIFSIPALVVQLRYGSRWWNLIHEETPESRRLNYYQMLMSGRYEMKDLKLLNLRDMLLERYRALYDKLFNEQKSLVLRRHFWEILAYLLSDAVLFFFYFTLVLQAYARKITIGDFTFYSTTYMRGVSALNGLVRDISEIYENNLFIRELMGFFAETEEESGFGEKIPEKIDSIEFRDVWFKYPGTEEWVLQGVSFSLAPDKSVALVGENG
ncbi:MAG: ABC transporter ATP-binding protein, partial [Candidatus Aenigmarchaeota archaeon]|nr:ABC transporter ATP-binding protein [Candidatus Aenigmarchaeota archaeon]